jgi:hypothetical protein
MEAALGGGVGVVAAGVEGIAFGSVLRVVTVVCGFLAPLGRGVLFEL